MSDEIRPGYYKDKDGNWQKDRRKTPDRRAVSGTEFPHHDRRRWIRRKADREAMERDHKEMIEDALDEFAARHHHEDH